MNGRGGAWLVLALVAGPVFAGPHEGRLEVTVLDDTSGVPLFCATVTAEPGSHWGSTDQQGLCVFDPVSPGDHVLNVMMDQRYWSKQLTIGVSANPPVTQVTVRLERVLPDLAIRMIEPTGGPVGGQVPVIYELKYQGMVYEPQKLYLWSWDAQSQRSAAVVSYPQYDANQIPQNSIVSDQWTGNTRVVQIRDWWDTLPLQNGTQELRIAAEFTNPFGATIWLGTPPPDQDSPGVSGGATTSPLVKNLTVTNITGGGHDDYFPYCPEDPEVAEPVTFTVTLDDNDLNDPVDVEFRLYSTMDPASPKRVLTVQDVTSSTCYVQWDGLLSDGEQWQVAADGIYTYDVIATQDADMDQWQYRSPSLRGVSDGMDFRTSEDGSEDFFGFWYSLSEAPASSGVLVEYWPDFGVYGDSQSLSAQSLTSVQALLFPYSADGLPHCRTAACVVVATDPHGTTNRHRSARKALPFNKRKIETLKLFYCQFVLNGQSSGGRLQEVRRVIVVEKPGWLAAYRVVSAGAWAVSQSWETRSGSAPTEVNSPSLLHQWRMNGPTPTSSTVKQNGTGTDPSGKHYLLDAGGPMDSRNKGMRFLSSFLTNGEGGSETGFRYRLRNGQRGDTHSEWDPVGEDDDADNDGNSGETRQYLRVHVDEDIPVEQIDADPDPILVEWDDNEEVRDWHYTWAGGVPDEDDHHPMPGSHGCLAITNDIYDAVARYLGGYGAEEKAQWRNHYQPNGIPAPLTLMLKYWVDIDAITQWEPYSPTHEASGERRDLPLYVYAGAAPPLGAAHRARAFKIPDL